MPALSPREKRTIRIAAIAMLIYLAGFMGFLAIKRLEAWRSDYQELVEQAREKEARLRPYENKVLLIEKLRDQLRVTPSQLSRTSLVAQASAALQQAARSGGIQLGPVRETPGRASARELAGMQLEGMGQLDAVLKFLHHVHALGHPIAIDTLQLTPERMRPGFVKMTMQLIIFDFDQWKLEERPNA